MLTADTELILSRDSNLIGDRRGVETFCFTECSSEGGRRGRGHDIIRTWEIHYGCFKCHGLNMLIVMLKIGKAVLQMLEES